MGRASRRADRGSGTDAPRLPALASLSGTELRLYYVRSEGGLTFAVQQSSSLAPSGWTQTGVSAELYDATTGLFDQAAPIEPGEPAKFLRLQVIKP